MAAVTVRRIPEETMRALKALAGENGRSVEAELRAMIERRVGPMRRDALGALLSYLGGVAGGLDLYPPRWHGPVAAGDEVGLDVA